MIETKDKQPVHEGVTLFGPALVCLLDNHPSHVGLPDIANKNSRHSMK